MGATVRDKKFKDGQTTSMKRFRTGTVFMESNSDALGK
jgi:hypothetical protein